MPLRSTYESLPLFQTVFRHYLALYTTLTTRAALASFIILIGARQVYSAYSNANNQASFLTIDKAVIDRRNGDTTTNIIETGLGRRRWSR